MQTSTLSTITLPELVDLTMRTFVKNQQMVKPSASQLFIKDSIGQGQGNTKKYQEVDTQTFARLKRQLEAVKRASVGTGYEKTITKKRIGMEIEISQEMLDENRYAQVGSLFRSLAHFCPQRIDLDLTHRFTFASATSYTDMDGETVDLTTGDGYALAYNAHTLKYSSTTWSNRVTGDPIFSAGALEIAEQLATTNIYSNFGEKRVMAFNTIVTGDDPSTVNAVRRVLQSTADVDGAHAGIENVNKSKYRHVILPNLATTAGGAPDSTKRRYWFLASVGMGTDGWQGYFAEWEAPHLKTPTLSEYDGFSRDGYKSGVRAGYGIAVLTARGTIFALPTA